MITQVRFHRWKREDHGYVDPATILEYPGVSETPVRGYERNTSTGIFSKEIPLKTLLTSNKDCLAAGFGENLYVYAMATDGWSRMYSLDSYALPKAFALAPKGE